MGFVLRFERVRIFGLLKVEEDGEVEDTWRVLRPLLALSEFKFHVMRASPPSD